MVVGKRVDCVKVHKSGSRKFLELSGGRDTAKVYDITVGGHPSFYADDVLVHNCVQQERTDPYNTDIYYYVKISDEFLMDRGGDITALLDFPQAHRKWKKFWVGMDVGYTNHPSEILVFGEETPKGADASVLTLLTRVNLDRVGHNAQVNAIAHLIRWYNPEVFAMDKTGNGLPLYQDLQERYPRFVNVIKGYNFSSKILVDFDQSVEIDEFKGDAVRDAGIERNVLEYASDKLRDFVDSKRIMLPWDRELIGEFQGQTYRIVRDSLNQYGKREYNKGQFHALDAAKMAVLGKVQAPIEDLTREDKFEPTPIVFL